MTSVYTRAEIERAVRPADAIEAIADGFIAFSQRRAVVPPPGHLELTEAPGDCHIKYGYIRGDDTFTVKIATGFYRNPERGLPSSNGVMLVFSAEHGGLLAILQDDGYLTDIRTAAAGAVAARCLAPSRIERIGVIGAGTQARLQLEYLKEVTPCRRVSLWTRSRDKAKAFQVGDFAIDIKDSPAAVAADATLIVTTTPATGWLIEANAVRPGTHITAVGADGAGKQELDPRLFGRAGVCAVDSPDQCAQFGESSHALAAGLIRMDRLIELGEILQNPSQGRSSDEEITIADLTGVAIQDIQIAKLALRELAFSPLNTAARPASPREAT